MCFIIAKKKRGRVILWTTNFLFSTVSFSFFSKIWKYAFILFYKISKMKSEIFLFSKNEKWNFSEFACCCYRLYYGDISNVYLNIDYNSIDRSNCFSPKRIEIEYYDENWIYQCMDEGDPGFTPGKKFCNGRYRVLIDKISLKNFY